MSNLIKILVFAGSVRKDSYNKKLAKVASESAKRSGAEVTLIDLKDYIFPIYDQDLEFSEGIPANVKKFQELMSEHQGFLIACPEYNSSVTPLLVNVIAWTSRSDPKTPYACYKNKFVGLLSASPGNLGGIRGLVPVRSMLTTMGSFVLPSQVAVPRAHDAFTEDFKLKDQKLQDAVDLLTLQLVDFIKKMN